MLDIENKVQYSEDSPTGLRFKVKCGRGRNVKHPGDVAGVVGLHGSGYTLVCGKLAHRVVWYLHHGYWPENIDHINGIRTDNRICNLREVTHEENCQNRQHATGYTWSEARKKFCVVIKRKNCGRYDTALEARAAYLRHAKELLPMRAIGGEIQCA